METKIFIIRHGQSIGNMTKTFLGHTDLDLSEMGYKQAEATAKHLFNEKIDIIYSSDLKRAYNTALPHAKIRNIGIITSKKLRETQVGEWENLLVDEIIGKWGSDYFINNWKNGFGTFTFPSGESIIDAGKRFFDEILRICNENKGKTILISSHAAVIRSFWGIISGIAPDELSEKVPFATNASYSICYYENGIISPSEYSNDAHLNDVGITKVNLI